MPFILSKIVAPTLTRKRTGEDLSDPITEFEDGDGEGIDVEGLFQHLIPHKEFDVEVDLEASAETNGVESFEVKAGEDLASASTGKRDPEGEPQGERGEELDRWILFALGRGLRPFLRTLAARARNRALHIRHSQELGGNVIRARVHAHGEALEVRLEISGAPRGQSGSVLSIRSSPPALGLRVEGRLRLDGSVRDARVQFRESAERGPTDGLRAAFAAVFERLERMDPLEAGAVLGEAMARSTSALVAFVARCADALSLSVPAGDGLSAVPPLVALTWASDGEPHLHTEETPARDLSADLTIIQRFISIVRAIPKS